METRKKCPYCSRVCKIPNIVLVASSSACPSSQQHASAPAPSPAKSAAHVRELSALQTLDVKVAVRQIEKTTKPEVLSDFIGSVATRLMRAKSFSLGGGGGSGEKEEEATDIRADVELLKAGLKQLNDLNQPLGIDSAVKLGETIHALALSRGATEKAAARALRTLWQKLEPHSFDAWRELQQLREQAAVLRQTIDERNAEQARIDQAVAESTRILETLKQAQKQAEEKIQHIGEKNKKATPEQLANLQELQDQMKQCAERFANCQRQIDLSTASLAKQKQMCDAHTAKLAQLEQTAATACSVHEERLETCDKDAAAKDARIRALEQELATCAAKAQGDGVVRDSETVETLRGELAAKDARLAALESQISAVAQDQLLQEEVADLKEKLHACDAKTTQVLDSDDMSTNTKYAKVEELEEEMEGLRAQLKMCEEKNPESAKQREALCKAWFAAELTTYKTQWAEVYQKRIADSDAEHVAKMTAAQAEKDNFEKVNAEWKEATEQAKAREKSALEVAAQYAAAVKEQEASAAALAKEKTALDTEYGGAYKKYRQELLDSHEANVKKFAAEKDKQEKVLAERLAQYDDKLTALTSEQWHVSKVAELENARHEAQVAADEARAAKQKHEENATAAQSARQQMEAELAAQQKTMKTEAADLAKLRQQQEQLIEQKADQLFQTTFEQKNKLALEAKRAACVDVEAIVSKFEAQFVALSEKYNDTLVMAGYVPAEFEKAVKKVLNTVPKPSNDGQAIEGAERVAQIGKELDAALREFKKEAKEWVQDPGAELKEALASMTQSVKELEKRADEAMVNSGRSAAPLGGGGCGSGSGCGQHRTYSSMFYGQ